MSKWVQAHKPQSVFKKHDQIIYAMRQVGGTHETIIKYLCTIDQTIKTKYQNNQSSGIKRLSAYLKALDKKGYAPTVVVAQAPVVENNESWLTEEEKKLLKLTINDLIDISNGDYNRFRALNFRRLSVADKIGTRLNDELTDEEKNLTELSVDDLLKIADGDHDKFQTLSLKQKVYSRILMTKL